MLIKSRDDDSEYMQQLEAAAAAGGADAKRALVEARNRKAGARAEDEAAYLIDLEFKSRNWAVIHDLRVEVDGEVAQIDHVLINRLLEVYVLETKSFHAGVKINEAGEFLRWNDFKKTFEGMPSPLMQNDRHVTVLRRAFKLIDMPRRLGFRLEPSFVPYVLVSSKSRVDRPKKYDTSRLIKSDQFIEHVRTDNDLTNALYLAKVVSPETVESIARQLAHLHKPLKRGVAACIVPETVEPSVVAAPTPPPVTAPTAAPAIVREQATAENATGLCRSCKGSIGNVQYGRYGYYFDCACGTSTSLRLQCGNGHSAKVRKKGAEFFKDCTECGTSDLLHTNQAA